MVSDDVQRVFILLKVSLLMALLPASASAVTITISAPSESATEITLTATGTYNFGGGDPFLIFEQYREFSRRRRARI
jgi:uncharacterized protein (DUF2141 family)